jgi:hypothetical protein
MFRQISNALDSLLSGLIDYAGLFPPAALSMQEAVNNFARYIEGEHAWMLGRFVLPLSRLDEFEEAAKVFLNSKIVWRLSVLCNTSEEELKTIEDFNRCYESRAIIDAIEIKANNAEEIQQVSTACTYGRVSIFCEIPIAENLNELIHAIAESNIYAKARTGGVKQNMFPSAEEVTRFVFACHQSNVAFKATAGLHHPIRCLKPLTYEANAEHGVMHGFLNVFLAAAFIRNGMSEDEAIELLLDENVSSFAFEDETIRWRSYKLNADELRDARENFALSFGSCSFEEPVEELRELGICFKPTK